MRKILVVAAHPDDEILGAGATVARLIKEGAECHTLILGEGITSRENWQESELMELKDQSWNANHIIGLGAVTMLSFPDNKFDSVPLLDIVKSIDKKIEEFKPDIIFTHFRNDLNCDHRLSYQAVITATRPTRDCLVREIYSFEILSSTEWSYPLSFSPNIYFDVSDTIRLKIEAMRQYKGELREWPHPRSIEGICFLAEYRGMQGGMQYAEAFEAVRILR